MSIPKILAFPVSSDFLSEVSQYMAERNFIEALEIGKKYYYSSKVKQGTNYFDNVNENVLEEKNNVEKTILKMRARLKIKKCVLVSKWNVVSNCLL